MLESGDHGSIATFLPLGPRVVNTVFESLFAPIKIFKFDI